MTARAGLALLGAFLLATTAYAQSSAGGSQSQGMGLGSLSIHSNPSGVVVTLRGREITLAGRTPWKISRGIEGIYTLEAKVEGFETFRRTVYLDPAASDTLHINLVSKTRAKAGFRSIIFPGWGQFYTQQKWKGWAFLGGTVLAGAGVIITNEEYQDRRDVLERVHQSYLDADQVEEREQLWTQVEVALKRTDDASRYRDIAVAALIGVYALNVLDAIFLFPEPPRAIFSADGGGGVFADVRPDGMNVGVRLSY